jgi:RHS repeat-associated protein
MAAPQQAEKRKEHRATSLAPDWKYTPKKPNKGLPVPYVTTSYFNEAVDVADQSNGRENDYFISLSTVPKSYGGEAGKGNGVLSNAYMDEFKPTEWSQSLLIDKGNAVFDGHRGTINKGNTSALVYTSTTAGKAVVDQACWERLKTGAAVLGVATKEKIASDTTGCAFEVGKGAYNSVKSDVVGVWETLKSAGSALGTAVMNPVDTYKNVKGFAEAAYKEAEGIVSGLRDGSITPQDIMDLAADLAGDMLCAIADEVEKMIKEGKGCEALGYIVGQVAMTIATGAAGKAGLASKFDIKAGDTMADMIKKIKKKKADAKKPPAAASPPSPNKEVPPAQTASSTPGPDKSPACPICPTAGKHPVNPVLGVKILASELDLDFDLPAVLPMPWQRTYVSGNAHVGWLGQGWTLPLSLTLERRPRKDQIALIDEFGRDITFPLIKSGASATNGFEQLTLSSTDNGRYEVASVDREARYIFAPIELDDKDRSGTRAKRLVLVGIQDRNDNLIRLQYSDASLPIYLYDSAGRVLGLGFQGISSSGANSAQKKSPIRLTRVAEFRGPHDGEGRWKPEQIVDLVRYEYSSEGDLITVRNRLGKVVREFKYRDNMLIEHGQPGAVAARYEYDQYSAKGRVTRSIINTGEHFDFDYFGDHTLVTDQLGRVVRYNFDADRYWTGTVDALGGTTLRHLDPWGNLTSLTDASGRTTRYVVDKNANPTQVIAPDGATTRIVYDARFNRPSVITDALGNATTYSYDERGNLASTTDPNGNETSYTLDQQGLITSITDPLGKCKTLTYNRAGQVLSYTDCSGNATHYTYDENSYPASITDALANTTRYTHDVLGRLLSVAHPDGSVEHFEYDTLGRLVAYSDPLGAKTTYTLDVDGLHLARKNALGATLEYQYDGARRLTALQNENRAVYHFSYDPLDRLIEESGFDGRLTRYSYDPSGLPTAKLEYGTLNEAQRQSLPGAEKSETPAAQSALIPAQRTAPTFDDPWGLGFDALGMPDATKLPAGAIRTHYERDKAGRLTQKLVAGLVNASQAVLLSGARADAQAQFHSTRYVYDALGRLTEAINDRGSRITLGYDAVGQLIAEKSLGGAPGNLAVGRVSENTLAHRYDALGNRTETQLPERLGAHTLNSLYYGSGHLHQINLDGEIICDFERDNLYREVSRTQGALASRYSYDAMGRLTQQYAQLRGSAGVGVGLGARAKATQTAPQESNQARQTDPPHSARASLLAQRITRDYAYDRAGNLTQVNDGKWGATRYGYDAIGRIKSARQSGAIQSNETFAFDPAHNIVDLGSGDAGVGAGGGMGVANANSPLPAAQNSPISSNIAQKSGISGGSTGRINQSNRLEVFEDKRYRYDTHGNLIQKKIGSHTLIQLSWDVEHQLTESIVTRHANDPKRTTKQTTQYRYDAFGRRVEKKDAFGTTHFLWDGNRLLAETRGSKTITYLYEPDSFAPLAQIERATSPTNAANATNATDATNAQTLPPLPLREGRGEGMHGATHGGTHAQTPEEIELTPRQAAANFQQMMLAKQREIKAIASGGRREMASEANAANEAKEQNTANTAQTAPQVLTASESENPRPWRIHYYHNDHLGTPRELSGEAGEIQWAATYKAWGNTLTVEWEQTSANATAQRNEIPAAQNEPVSEKISQKNATTDANEADEIHQPLRFQGQYYDNETGLHYNRFRYYDPDCGRFVSQDPFGLRGGDHFYQYAPNAQNWIDPLGLSKKPASQSGKCKKCDDPCADKGTSTAARRKAMMLAGIPLSIPPVAQRGAGDFRQYLYKISSGESADSYRIVSHHPKDSEHPCPHWHAGIPKDMTNGEPSKFSNDAWKYRSGSITVQHK